MSLSECERFAADLKSNETLRAEAGKAQAGTSAAMATEGLAAFAATKGYAFTADDMKQYAKATKLTDEQLTGIVGGTDYTISIINKSSQDPSFDFFKKPPPTGG